MYTSDLFIDSLSLCDRSLRMIVSVKIEHDIRPFCNTKKEEFFLFCNKVVMKKPCDSDSLLNL